MSKSNTGLVIYIIWMYHGNENKTRSIEMDNNKRSGIRTLFIMLSVFWVIISLRIDLIQALIGFMASALIVFYCYDMVFTSGEATKLTVRSLMAFFVLAFVFVKAMIVANLGVAKIVLSRKMDLDSGFHRVRQPLKKDLNKAFYGNAITLTPGTLAVDIENDWIVVHALRPAYAGTLEDGVVEKAFQRLEEGGK